MKKSMIFICIMLIISGILFLLPNMLQNGNQVVVTIDGNVYDQYDLDKNDIITIPQENDYNIIEIKDGKVNMKESTCKNQICVHHASISKEYPGSIVCLPHKLIVEIKE